MSLISKFSFRGKSIAALSLAALLPVAALMACSSEPPKIPGAPKSDTVQNDQPATTAPSPVPAAPSGGDAGGDYDKSASGGQRPPYGTTVSPEEAVQASRGANTPQSEQDILVREEQMRRAAEAEARYRAHCAGGIGMGIERVVGCTPRLSHFLGPPRLAS